MNKKSILFKNITYFNKYILMTFSILIILTSGLTSYAFFTGEITGTNDIVLTIKEHPCFDWTETATEVTITNYKCYAGNPYNYPTITNVTIPTKLNNKNVVAIANTTETLKQSFFQRGLTSIVFPNTLKTIGNFAFFDNYLTGTLIIPASVTSIGKDAFFSTIKNTYNPLTGLTFQPESNLNFIGDGAFARNNINSLSTLPNLTKLQTIDNWAFFDNSLTGTITIPANVTTIGLQTFGTNQLTGIIFQSGTKLTLLKDYAFRNNLITNVTIPDSVVTISNGAFEHNKLTTVTIGSKVTSIGQNAFYKLGTSNSELIKIINKTGRSFDWTNITYAYASQNFITGTIIHAAGNIEVTAN